jgi:hypothetical protein
MMMLPTNKYCTINGPEVVVGRRWSLLFFVLSIWVLFQRSEGERRKIGWTQRRLVFALRPFTNSANGRDSWLPLGKEEEKLFTFGYRIGKK